MIGIAVVTPLLLRFVFRQQTLYSRELAARAGRNFLCCPDRRRALGHRGSERRWSESLYGFRLFYLLFVPVVTAAVRHGLDGACFSLAITQFGLIGLLHLSGYGTTAFTDFQVQMLVLTVTGLIVGVVVSERRESQSARARSASEPDGKAGGRGARRAAQSRERHGIGARARNRATDDGRARARALRAAYSAHPRRRHDARRQEHDFAARAYRSRGIDREPHAGFHPPRQTACQHVDTRKMLEQALTLAYAEASAKQVKLDLDVPDDLPALHGDHVQLEQVVLNLVHNAVEAISAAGKKTAMSGSSRACIRRRRGSRSASSTTGLASTTSSRIACSIRSRPRSRMASGLAFRSARRLSKRMAAVYGCMREKRARPNSVFQCRSVNRTGPSDGEPPTIFVIDDHAAVRHALGEMLSVFGYTVETFESADRFLQALGSNASRLCRRGCEHAGDGRHRPCARARAAQVFRFRSFSFPDTPMCRWRSRRSSRAREDFIEKPVDDAQLVAAINRALARRLEHQDSRSSQDALGDKFARLTPRQMEIFDLVVGGIHEPRDFGEAQHQRANRRELPRRNHGKDASRERRGARAAGRPAWAHHPVKLPPDRYGYFHRSEALYLGERTHAAKGACAVTTRPGSLTHWHGASPPRKVDARALLVMEPPMTLWKTEHERRYRIQPRAADGIWTSPSSSARVGSRLAFRLAYSAPIRAARALHGVAHHRRAFPAVRPLRRRQPAHTAGVTALGCRRRTSRWFGSAPGSRAILHIVSSRFRWRL